MSETKDTTLRDRLAEKAPYTPRIEFNCDGSQTHYQGCKCHEERHQAEVARLKRQLEVAKIAFFKIDSYCECCDKGFDSAPCTCFDDPSSNQIAAETLAEIDGIGKEEG